MLYTKIVEKIILSEYKKPTKELKPVSFDIDDALKIIEDAFLYFNEEPAVLDINTFKDPIVVVGDIHGNITSLLKIFQLKGYPPKTSYLFLGDYVDRGMYSCEVIMLLYSLKCLFPDKIYLIRGNHEFKDLTENYGFKFECLHRASQSFYDKVVESFSALPICALIKSKVHSSEIPEKNHNRNIEYFKFNNENYLIYDEKISGEESSDDFSSDNEKKNFEIETTFCVHGGISQYLKSREDFKLISKPGLTMTNKLHADLLWSDPSIDILNYEKSPRGISSIYGEDATNEFMTNCGISNIIRAHQNVTTGYEWPFGEQTKLLTVFSSLDYCNTLNDAGFAIIQNDQKIMTESFSVLPGRIERKQILTLPEWITSRQFETKKSQIKLPALAIFDTMFDLSVPALLV
ncbi:Ser/Thr protein phosphatase [Tritrichomonas foetus]|uniref:Serine/threonine-protein phosphatase n=1 Tax=Tritrichomonas foetus TaxID=1144522 RepID=A0A1J4J0K8_9EUKA|nr:Ser/Thr protein phosphatase [Tritrichomonas foetus]|eukprot:OHS92938.1 Ser/Thr protein phosphatase [Tritrichomonas foetus]